MDVLYNEAVDNASVTGDFGDPDSEKEFNLAKHTADILAGALFVMTDDLIQSLSKRIKGPMGAKLGVGPHLRGVTFSQIAWAAANNLRHHSEWQRDALQCSDVDEVVAWEPDDIFLKEFRADDVCFEKLDPSMVERRLRQLRSIRILNAARDDYHAITGLVTFDVLQEMHECGVSSSREFCDAITASTNELVRRRGAEYVDGFNRAREWDERQSDLAST
jgi:hypothetical protein